MKALMPALVIIIYGTVAFAEPGAERWRISVEEDKLGDIVYVFDKKEPDRKPFRYKSEGHSGNFVEGVIVFFRGYRTPFLLTKWLSGAHAETLLVFDLDNLRERPVFLYVSSWPMTWEMIDGVLTVFGTGDYESADQTPEQDIVKWHPDRNSLLRDSP
ncbi:MAG: hypothetical protein JRJ47_00940 [Deltaproteobacteria bacterium]|nr:hypothetical protein [Deltaproteobacteria bacterium]